MSPREEITPEEKLLNLIRHSDKKSTKQKPPAKQSAPGENELSKSATTSASLKTPLLKEVKMIVSGLKSLNFVIINRLILFVAFVAFLLLLFDLFYYSPKLSKLRYSSKRREEIISLKNKETKPFSHYEQEIVQRQLFSPSPGESSVKKVIPAGPTFRELIKGLKLLGVVSGDSPQVIIEDEKLRKTYFLYTGDYLGEIRVEEVNSDRVILEFKGERISLFL